MRAAAEAPARGAVVRELILEAIQNLDTVRQRTLLALIGIAIGTASVIAMLNIGHNARLESLRQFKATGIELLVVHRSYDLSGSAPAIRPDDVAALVNETAGLEAAAPLAVTSSDVLFEGRTAQSIVMGGTATLARIAQFRVHTGRFISDFDGNQTYAVVGHKLALKLGTAGRPLAVGDALRLENHVYTVIGILDDGVPNPLFPAALDDALIVPLQSVRRIAADPQITTVVARMRADADEAATARQVAHFFSKRLRGSEVQVQTARQLIATMERQMDLYTLLLSAIGGISLIVGGVGVMNVMLMGALERRQEIGLRLALGARRRDIGIMFLAEALILALLGGLAGTGCGVLAAAAFTAFSNWHFDLALATLPLGAGVSMAAGLIFGIYPALSAARLDPIVALRAT